VMESSIREFEEGRCKWKEANGEERRSELILLRKISQYRNNVWKKR